MPKKQSFGANQGVSSRQTLIILGTTLLAAIIIVVIFAFFINRDSGNNQDYQNYLDSLKSRQNTGQKEIQAPAEEVQRQIVRGVLTAINPETITVTAEGTNQKIEISLRPETSITYQNQTFDKSRFYIGDQLEITARPEAGGLAAESITVLVSASPATPAPLPVITPQNIRPDGSIKPL